MARTSIEPPSPTLDELAETRRVFRQREKRGLYYWVALDLLRLSDEGQTWITTSEALAVLLESWNSAYFRYHPYGDETTLDSELKKLLHRHHQGLAARRTRSIEDFEPDEGHELSFIRSLFGDFEAALGPVGAAKTLHLLCPQYFPIWDRRIAHRYGQGLLPVSQGGNADRYLRFMEITQHQCQCFGGQHALGRNPLKALDEYNYCHYTRNWL